MAARVEDEYIFPMRDASTNKRNVARDLKKLEKETDEGRSDLTSAAIKRQADILMENGDKAGVASLYRKSMKDYARRAEVFEALMGQYYQYVSQEPEAVLQLAKEAESSYNRYIRTKSDDYFKVKKEVAIQRKIAGYYEKGGNEKRPLPCARTRRSGRRTARRASGRRDSPAGRLRPHPSFPQARGPGRLRLRHTRGMNVFRLECCLIFN